jgi:hypothetical protein
VLLIKEAITPAEDLQVGVRKWFEVDYECRLFPETGKHYEFFFGERVIEKQETKKNSGLGYQICCKGSWHRVWHRCPENILFNLKLFIMHNTDRTTGELGYEFEQEFANEFNQENFELNELSQELENAFEMADEYSGELAQEYQGEYSGELSGEVFNESMEMELASELLNVTNEQEMDQFLGKLVKRAAGAVGRFAKSSAGKAIGGFLKSAAKKALPWAGRALGAAIGGPAGGFIGGKLGSYASTLFELELEGMSNEDKEFEVARAYVRFAGDAVRRAARNPAHRYNPRQAVRTAVVNSARRHAPGFLRRRPRRRYVPSSRPVYSNPIDSGMQQGYGAAMNTTESGTWYKEGNQIILNL